ncbi:YggS family pyridoxal phosphate-dependent enzyme [bacterium]|nr:YggS family pyridoxal phosphate-dependent enzyme [bacterium]
MISEKIKNILREIPNNIELVAAAKGKSPQEISEAIDAGVKLVGENYVQEAQAAFDAIGNKVKWHFIGHLQTNKVKYAVKIFDMIETVDSIKLASEIDKRCKPLNKIMPILIEVNSGNEDQKSGASPTDCIELIKKISKLENIKVMGLMTMAPFFDDPELARPYFNKTKQLFDEINQMDIPNVEIKYLSMGMTDTYKIAIEEGANIVRIGTKIFGERNCRY